MLSECVGLKSTVAPVTLLMRRSQFEALASAASDVELV